MAGDKIQFTHAPEELSSMISDVMKGWTHFYEDRIVTVPSQCTAQKMTTGVNMILR